MLIKEKKKQKHLKSRFLHCYMAQWLLLSWKLDSLRLNVCIDEPGSVNCHHSPSIILIYDWNMYCTLMCIFMNCS